MAFHGFFYICSILYSIVCSTIVLVLYKEKSHDSRSIRFNMAYSYSSRERKRKYVFSKMAANLKIKRASIATVRDQYSALTTFFNLLYSLPFKSWSPYCLFINIFSIFIYVCRFTTLTYKCWGVDVNFTDVYCLQYIR